MDNKAAPMPELNSMIHKGFKLNLSWMPKSTGSLIPNNCDSIAPILVCLIFCFLALTKNAKHVPTLANPYIAHKVIKGLNPVLANKDVSIMT